MADLPAALVLDPADEAGPARDVAPFVRREADPGSNVLHLLVEGVHCGACVRKIERRLEREGGLDAARVNLTTRRLTIRWQGEPARGNRLAQVVAELGYGVVPFDPDRLRSLDDRSERELLRCVAVAGFAASNVMLLAVSVWAGHFSGMGDATRTFLHWFEALIALPAIAYAGRPFFRSAFRVLRAGRTNMDVPISLAVILAPGMSLVETIRGGQHAYFDSAVTLLFFLLIGRYLDRRARGNARSAAERLLALNAVAVSLLLPDGATRSVRPEQLEAGQEILVATGERVGADGAVSSGGGELDTSLITGETVPQRVAPGDRVFAGTINLGPPLRLRVRAAGEGTLLAEIVRLMELAEQRRSRFVAIADRVARAYAPVGAQPGPADPPRLDAHRRGTLANGPALRHRRPDHHLPLCAGTGRAGRAGAGQQPPDAAWNPAEIGDGAGAVRARRHGGVRQDRHAHPGPADPGRRG
jgi:P-type Cu2+ transporter